MRKTLPNLHRVVLTVLFLGLIPLQMKAQELVSVLQRFPTPGSSEQVMRSLKDVLQEVQEQYKVDFAYQENSIAEKLVKSRIEKGRTIEQVLVEVLEPHGLTYVKIDQEFYAIVPKSEAKTSVAPANRPMGNLHSGMAAAPAKLSVSSAKALETRITGKVTSSDKGEGLPGVTVVLKGTTVGTSTDNNGAFALTLPEATGLLVFSYIGFESQEVALDNRSVINVQLKPDAKSLEEVIVVGYGEQSRATVVGAIATLKAAEVEDIPAANLSSLLQGRMPGVHTGQSSGRPGAGTSFNIRTSGSWNAEPPLFVIDGFIRDQAAFDVLDPSEVESVSVLKDASAAVYGARGAGGVILVKTKRGKSGKARINYSGSYGVSDATMVPDMLSAYDHATLVNNRLRVTNPTNYVTQRDWFTDDELEHANTLDHNWLDEAWRRAPTSRHAVNISGGTDKVRYFGGGSYYDEKGNLPGTHLQKYTLRLGLEADITKDLTASFQLSGDNRMDRRPFNNDDSNPDPMNGTFTALLQAPRWIPPYINGLPVGQNGTVATHPLEIDRVNSYARGTGSNLVVNSALEYMVPFVEGLRVRVAYSQSQSNGYGKQMRVNYDLYNFQMTGGNNHIFTDVVSGPPRRINNRERLQESFDRATSYQLNGSLLYDRRFGLHEVNSLLVYEQAENQGNSFSALREDMVIPGYERQEGFSEAKDGTSSGASAGSRLSYIGRLNYGYAGKYLLEAAFRYEGSIKFPPHSRWGLFPAVAAGWRISEEPFFKNNVPFVNNLKLRASAGLLGNDNIGARQWELSYGTTGGAYLGGSTLTNAVQPRNNGIIASAVTWEKTRSYNGGIDMGFTNGISLGFDYFYRYTYDILGTRNSTLPTSTGIDRMPNENYGRMDSWGYDGSINYNANVTDDLRFNVGLNLSWAKSRVLEKYQNPAVIGTWADEIGKMPNGEVGYFATGIIRSQEELDAILEVNPSYTIFGRKPELGMLNYADVGGPNYSNEPDGKIDANDQRMIAPAVAALGFGINLGVSWKGFRIGTNFGLSGLSTQVFYDKEAMTAPTATLNGPSFWRNHWTPENPSAAYPRPVNYGGDGQRSTFWMRDGLRMQMNNANVSYDLPRSLSERFGIPQMRIYFAGRNLWTIINPFDYKDPSHSRFNSYPMMRTYNMGLNITI